MCGDAGLETFTLLNVLSGNAGLILEFTLLNVLYKDAGSRTFT